MTRKFSKEKISIQNIGRQRFWMGIVSGLFSAVVISITLNYFREFYRFFTTLTTDLLILKESELQFFNYFFPSLATVLGLSITVSIWMTNSNHKRKRDRMNKQVARTNNLLIFWLILMMITRFGGVMTLVINGRGYDNQLNLFEEYWLLFILILVVIFIQSWFLVRLIYRSVSWILFSFIICIAIAFTLKTTTSVDQELLNTSYHKGFESDYKYIDQQIAQAKNEYGIVFQQRTINTLKKWYTENSTNQVNSLKLTFSKDHQVSLDSIILQKIVIRNFKEGHGYYRDRANTIENWWYAYPIDIYRQLEFYDINSNESKELLEIIKEQINLVNAPIIDWDEYDKYTSTEIRKSRGVQYDIPEPLIQQLKQIRDSIINKKEFDQLSINLPEIRNRYKKQ